MKMKRMKLKRMKLKMKKKVLPRRRRYYFRKGEFKVQLCIEQHILFGKTNI